MKSKLIAFTLICATGITILYGCAESNSRGSVASTKDTAENLNIVFTANFNKADKKIETTLTNNTGDKILTYNQQYRLYKKESNEWVDVTFEHASYALDNKLFPDSGINSVDLNFSAFKTAGENLDYAKEKANTELKAGTYKITIDVNAYPESKAKIMPTNDDATYPSDNPEGKYIDTSEVEGETIFVSAEFTVD